MRRSAAVRAHEDVVADLAIARNRYAGRNLDKVAYDAIVANACARIDDNKLAEVGADRNNRLCCDIRAVLEFGRGRNLRRRVDNRREVMAAKPAVYLGTQLVVADRDEDRALYDFPVHQLRGGASGLRPR